MIVVWQVLTKYVSLQLLKKYCYGIFNICDERFMKVIEV